MKYHLRLAAPFLLLLTQHAYAQSSVDQFIATFKPTFKSRLFDNIGANAGSNVKPGVVIASPSTDNPDYFFFWLRDGSLVFKYLIDEFVSSRDTTLQPLIENFITAQAAYQSFDNPSGTVVSGLNLGEPKFEVDETAFTGSWGRPQRDGPALRITALSTYANFLLDKNQGGNVSSRIWPILEKDAGYVANYWNLSTFDLWEEVQSSSFFTTAVQHRALREAVALGKRLGSSASELSAWSTQADNVLCFLQSYWNPSRGFITSNTGGGRSGIDANSVLTSIHTFDPNAGCDAVTFQPCSDKALSNLLVYVDSFRSIYAINSGIPTNQPAATGRYQEDVYMGGNPWYLTTLAVAEQLYLSLQTWSSQGSISISSTSLPFFRRFLSSATTGAFTSNTTTFTTLTTSLKSYADGFVSLVANHTPSNGGLAEQFSRNDGSPLSARDLTWSYASALTAFNAHDGLHSNIWGAKGLNVPQAACKSNPGPSSNVMFRVNATTVLGENIFLTGSIDALRNWSPPNALGPLDTSSYPIWTITVTVPASTPFEYKYIRKETDGSVVWESDPNNVFTAPGVGQTAVVNDVWR